MEIEIALGQLREAGGNTVSIEEDVLLARKIAAGDTDAWERFFTRYAPWVYRFVYRHLGGNVADAEDVCSDIMLTAARSIGKYDVRRGNLDAWMYGIARHALSRWCRRRRLVLPLIPDVADLSSAAETTSSHFTDALVVRDVVNRALASLPERQATVLVGKYIEGYSTDELAHRIRSSLKAVESLLVRARAAFRAAFSILLNDRSGGENGE